VERILRLAVAVLVASGCAEAPSESAATLESHGGATVTTNAANYDPTVDIVVNFSGLHGSATDWIALAPAGSPLTTATRWMYSGGVAAGSVTFTSGIPTGGGTYVARAFDNDTYVLMGESAPFTITDVSGAMISLDQTTYDIDQTIVVNFSGVPAGDKNWVAIKPQGSGYGIEARWVYAPNASSGTVTFPSGLYGGTDVFSGGNYHATFYINDTALIAAETGDVVFGCTVTTDLGTYSAFQPITINMTHLNADPNAYVALAPQGSSRDTITSFLFSTGSANFTRTFDDGLPAGTYVARGFPANTYFKSCESAAFTVVQNSTLVSDMPSYTFAQPITATWTNAPGNQFDWVGIAPAGSPLTTVSRWAYTNGQVNGSEVFLTDLGPGTYVLRLFRNNSYVLVAQSVTFTIN